MASTQFIKNSVLYSLCLLVLAGFSCFGLGSVLAQETPGSQQTRKDSGSQNSFSYRIQTTYGVQTSANVTGNLKADTEAVLKLKAGSLVTNKMGDEKGGSSVVFVSTPNGANVDLKGITGKNLFLIDDGTTFRSSLKSVDDSSNSTSNGKDTAKASNGTASATAVHTTTVTVEKGLTTFQNTFQQTF